jgi:hypothetical protein
VNGAKTRGWAFLAAQQDGTGFWEEDWRLPVGSSRIWTTAYVGWRLAASGGGGSDVGMLERAAEWLEANELPEGGWGYAALTGADADSTALGILFLAELGRPAPAGALHRLLGFARKDGGFGTYGLDRSFGAWTASQVEVTATAALALRMARGEGETVRRAERFLHGRRGTDGLWDSYWWTAPFYATEVSVRLLGDGARQAAAQALRGLPPSNAFEQALRGLVLLETQGALGEAQLPDGSWPSAPVLRLTRRDVFEPRQSADPGPCFADQRRLFTTATVLGALCLP